MNRITAILLLLMLLLGGIAYFLKTKSEKKGKTNQYSSDRNFAIEDEKDIYEIHVQQKSLPKYVFKRNEDHWRVNDQYRVDGNVIFNILKTLTKVKVDHIPIKKELTHIKSEIERIGIRVQVFDKNENKLRDYYIGENTNKEEGTYFLMNGADQAYTMMIPGLAGSLRSRFQHQMAKVRDRHMFRDLADDIVSITMEYPTDRVKGFTLIKEGSNYKVEKQYPGTKEINAPVNKRSAELYFKEFNKLASEAYENENENKADILKRTPFSKLSIQLKDGELKTLDLYPMSDILDSTINTVEVERLQSVERYFGNSNWGDFYLIQHRLIKGILRPYEYFFK